MLKPDCLQCGEVEEQGESPGSEEGRERGRREERGRSGLPRSRKGGEGGPANSESTTTPSRIRYGGTEPHERVGQEWGV